MSVKVGLSLCYEYHLYRLLKPCALCCQCLLQKGKVKLFLPATPLNNVLTPFRQPVGNNQTTQICVKGWGRGLNKFCRRFGQVLTVFY